MGEALHEFGLVAQIRADAVGPPGQRRFRLLIQGERGWAFLWLEKGQLMALATAIVQVIAERRRLGSSRGGSPEEGSSLPQIAPPEEAMVEIQVGQLALALEEHEAQLALFAYARDQSPDDEATFSCKVSVTQGQALSKEALAVCVAGRPCCPLCGAPLSPEESHLCPHSNGHVQIL